jgi:hypothetical protein
VVHAGPARPFGAGSCASNLPGIARLAAGTVPLSAAFA